MVPIRELALNGHDHNQCTRGGIAARAEDKDEIELRVPVIISAHECHTTFINTLTRKIITRHNYVGTVGVLLIAG